MGVNNNSYHQPQNLRKLPGILAALPKSLPFHPYPLDYRSLKRYQHIYKRRSRRCGVVDVDHDGDLKEGQRTETGIFVDVSKTVNDEVEFISDFPLAHITSELRSGDTFTLFLFADYTNRQSLIAISVVSKWFHYALKTECRSQIESTHSGNRVICIPNHPTQIDAVGSSRKASILKRSGFYELPFHHPLRFTLIRLLNATRVPSVIVVANCNGKIVTHYGWEAIDSEGSDGRCLDQWLHRQCLESKRHHDSRCKDPESDNTLCDSNFDSQVVNEWKKGRSGLPCWWHLLSWLI
ncbi:hypothetical protein ACHAW6_005818 [Cyclotella cf. meneghiniana]